MENEVDRSAKIIWDYMLLHHELRPMDAIFALGTYGTDIAERASDLFLQGYGKYLICAGNSGVVHGWEAHFDRPEADVYAEVALSRGVPREKILIENKSTNTGENILFVKELLKEKEIALASFILVQKPYMERRTYATFKKQWPGAECLVTSPITSFEQHKSEAERLGIDVISVMVGDLQRIKEYPSRGFQISQEIPRDVWEAYEKLIEFGFTSRLIKS